MGKINLLGLDLGTTTSKCILFNAELHDNHVLGKSEIRGLQTIYRSEPVFTPYLSQTLICEEKLYSLISHWVNKIQLISQTTLISAIVTGLAAQKQNVNAIERILEKYFGSSIMLTTTDPRLESWVAFMGSALKISKDNPESIVINIDIGGGTSNIALARNGQIFDTGSYFIGARHIIFQPGTYKIQSYTKYAQSLSQAVGLELHIENTLTSYQVSCYTEQLVQNLESVLYDKSNVNPKIIQASLSDFFLENDHIITFSGGVAELLYNSSQGAIAAYGDLGYELVAALKKSKLTKDISSFIAENKGRATVFGLAVNSFELSGNSIYISNDFELAIGNIPVVGHFHYEDNLEQLYELVESTKKIGGTAALYISFSKINLENIKKLSLIFRSYLSPQMKMVLILEPNIGKTLGSYISNWGQEKLSLLVLDQINPKPAQFVHIGNWVEGCLPVTFFGIT